MKSNKKKTQTEQIEPTQTNERIPTQQVNIIEKALGCDENLLNLLAEIITENIVRKIRNECHRIHKDQ